MKSRKYFVLLTLLVIVSMLAACAPAPAAEEPAAEATEAPASEATEAPAEEASGGTLTIGLPVEPETLDPGDAVYVQEQFILMNLFDSLLSISPDGELHPGLATAWEPNAD